MTATVSVLLVDDDAAFRHVLARELSRTGYEVTTAESGAEAIELAKRLAPRIVLLDLRLPGLSGVEVLEQVRAISPASDVIMLTGHGSIDTAIESMRRGAFDYVAKPCPLDDLEVRIQRALERQSLQNRARLLERGLTPPDMRGAFAGESPLFRQVLELIDRVAPTDSTVLITGETGSGKEMVAKLVHARSARAQRPFVVVECTSLQDSLLQSELFGHERGAFTGADRAKPGLFEVADRGTIFLDEIGEISEATQVKLLRVLDTGAFRRVGGTAEMRVDVRVIAATNRDVASMVRQRLFREDLYYRLSTITIRVPPLRERSGDIALLAGHFSALFNARFGSRKRIGPAAMAVLERHQWPGNVRELLHTIEAAMVLCPDEEIRPEHLPASLGAASVRAPEPDNGTVLTLDELERSHIEQVLRAESGHRGRAARLLGISERNLYRKLREYGMLS
jgi:DNA-binding NtrC family response regulator